MQNKDMEKVKICGKVFYENKKLDIFISKKRKYWYI